MGLIEMGRPTRGWGSGLRGKMRTVYLAAPISLCLLTADAVGCPALLMLCLEPKLILLLLHCSCQAPCHDTDRNSSHMSDCKDHKSHTSGPAGWLMGKGAGVWAPHGGKKEPTSAPQLSSDSTRALKECIPALSPLPHTNKQTNK